jgi:predicted DNA-binding protein YlxM (UPF0122 family)
MTDEERKRLVEGLRHAAVYNNPICETAANEIERLAEELRISNQALSICSDECNKLYEEYDKKLDEIKRLADERDQLVEQLAIRSETGMAKDMQEIMRINNELSERLALAQSNPLPREHQDPSKWPTRETVERAHALTQSDAEPHDSDGVTRKDVESWIRYFDEHAEEFVAAHEAIIRRSTK